MSLEINTTASPTEIEAEAKAKVERLNELFAIHDLLKKLTFNAQAVVVVRFPAGENQEAPGLAMLTFGAAEDGEFHAMLEWAGTP